MEDGESLVHVLVHDHSTTAVEVGHARTDELVRSKDVHIVDRLEDLRTGIAESLLEGITTGDDEGDFLGIHRVHLTVIDIDPDVTGIGTGKRTFCHLVVDTLEDGGHETEIDGATDDAVDELEFSTPLQIIGLLGLDVQDSLLAIDHELVAGGLTLDVRADEEMDLTELAGSTRLLLVAVLGIGDLGNGLAIRHLRSEELDVLLELVGHSPLHEVDSLLALSAEDGLAQLLGILNIDGRILGSDLVKSLANLCFVILVDGLDGATIPGIREDHMLDCINSRSGKGNIGLSSLQLHDASDITSAN